jgi:hypothetical protein
MNGTKLWYQSKLVWIGIIQTAIAVLLSASDLLQKGAITPADITIFLAGILTIIMRIWFTSTTLIVGGGGGQ